MDITAGDSFLCLCDQNVSYKYVRDFGRLRIYGLLKLATDGKGH